MLTAYVDESGQEQRDWMFVAGFVGNEDAWKMVKPEWKAAIAPRQHLHLNTLRFVKDRERKTLERAGAVPRACGLTPIIAGVRQADYLDIFEGTRTQKLLSGYVMCCIAIIINALRRIPADERLEVVFEQQTVYGERAAVAMQAIADSGISELLTKDGITKLANWRFVPKHTTLLTEPADYLAFALLQHWRNKSSRKAIWCHPILEGHDFQKTQSVMAGPVIRGILEPRKLLRLLEAARKIQEARE
jgi:hypothetical protein